MPAQYPYPETGWSVGRMRKSGQKLAMDLTKRGQPEQGGGLAEMERAAGMGLAARGGATGTFQMPSAIPVGKLTKGGTAGERLIQKAEASEAYETKLTPAEESQFKAWKQKYAPKDSGADYDLRGAFRAGLKPDPETGHWPDTFKKPNHPTFSDQSIYAKDRPDLAGRWDGDKYVPPGGGDADSSRIPQ